uniref:Caspase family p20 domain-containing protein n=1 Tax=Poecilia latipinna TaxID=48699 RepID=A0A3B3V1W2_9TELE
MGLLNSCYKKTSLISQYLKKIDIACYKYSNWNYCFLNMQPVGLCLIINNENFPNRKVKERRGTNKDAADVFSWLGFKVLMSTGVGCSGMVWPLAPCSPAAGSARRCLLCCILSHGSLHKVCGVDSQPLAIKEIRRYFVATKQPALTGKPKVFLIQACQGDKIQRGVLQKDAEEDSLTSIPEEADFLVAVSTVEDHVSFRDKTNGSWFIQSVCEQLKLHCPSSLCGNSRTLWLTGQFNPGFIKDNRFTCIHSGNSGIIYIIILLHFLSLEVLFSTQLFKSMTLNLLV